MLAAARPLLPAPPSWYPGHMTQFARMLPDLLRRTDVVLELRDSRLPLTSINPNFEGQSSMTQPGVSQSFARHRMSLVATRNVESGTKEYTIGVFVATTER